MTPYVAVQNYSFAPPGYELSPGGILLPAAPELPMTGIDLFAGCGGFSLGMHQGGIDVIAAVERDVTAAATYVLNLGAPGGRWLFVEEADRARFEKEVRKEARRSNGGEKWPALDDPAIFGANSMVRSGGCRVMVIGDIRKVTGSLLLDALGMRKGEVSIVFGGPPCQGFSKAGKQSPTDPRNNLILEFLRVIGELEPSGFAMENVPPLLTQDAFRELREAFFTEANRQGFNVCADVLDAAGYGVPQHRRRAFVLGVREGYSTPRLPLPTHWGIVARVDGSRCDTLEAYLPKSRGKEEKEEEVMGSEKSLDLLKQARDLVGKPGLTPRGLTQFESMLVAILHRVYHDHPVNLEDLAISIFGEERIKATKRKKGDLSRYVRNAVRRPLQKGFIVRAGRGCVVSRSSRCSDEEGAR